MKNEIAVRAGHDGPQTLEIVALSLGAFISLLTIHGLAVFIGLQEEASPPGLLNSV